MATKKMNSEFEGLPDQKARLKILRSHTARLQESGKLAPDVDIESLAAKTTNFTEAELEGLARSAISTAMYKLIKALGKNLVDHEEAEKLIVSKEDFEFAFEHDIKPDFGISDGKLDQYVKYGIIQWGPPIEHALHLRKLVVKHTRESSYTFIISMLIKGEPGCGKTALAVEIARSSNFPFIKVISHRDMIGYNETSKCRAIKKVFDDAYKSQLSCIVIDNIERLLDYVNFGPSFSNIVLQDLLVLLRENPPNCHRLLVVVTTGLSNELLTHLGLLEVFQYQACVPYLTQGSEVVTVLKNSGIFQPDDFSRLEQLGEKQFRVGIKDLLLRAELTSSIPNLISTLEEENYMN